MKATAIILAAGASKRMGLPKALLEADQGRSFLGRLAKIFTEAGLAPLVVLGAHAAQIQAAHPKLPSVLNPNWHDGQLSSVYVGLRAAISQGAGRILVHPVDTPMIASATASQLLAGLDHSPMLMARCEGKTGHPLGLRRDAAQRLLTCSATTLEEGAAILGAGHLEVADPLILDNLNTPEAYLRRFGRNPRVV